MPAANLVRRRTLIVLVVLLFGLPSEPRAYDLHAVYTEDCKVQVGFFLAVDAVNVILLDLEGRARSIPREQLRSLALFSVLTNPLAAVVLDPLVLEHLRLVHVGGSDTPLFTGFAVKFLEDLVIFHDLQGASHVFDMHDLTALRPLDLEPGRVVRAESVSEPDLDLGLGLDQCSEHPPQRGSSPPTRLISDRIRINGYLDELAEAFERLKSYEERTYLYARPFLFPERTRLVLLLRNDLAEIFQSGVLPVAFEWSTGTPYRFQSHTTIGAQIPSWLPTLTPVFALSSEVKSHLFNALFIGNVAALSAGTSLFAEGPFGVVLDRAYAIEPGFNYLAMMGADYLSWSVSLGTLFATYGLKTPTLQREVLGSEVSPVLRLMRTTARTRLRLLYGYSDLDRTGTELGDYLLLDSSGESMTDAALEAEASPPPGTSSPIPNPTSFSLRCDVLRLGLDLDLDDSIQLTLDGILVHGRYRERGSASDVDFRFTDLLPRLTVRHQFGHYVSLRGFLHLPWRYHDVAGQDRGWNHEFGYGGHFELLF